MAAPTLTGPSYLSYVTTSPNTLHPIRANTNRGTTQIMWVDSQGTLVTVMTDGTSDNGGFYYSIDDGANWHPCEQRTDNGNAGTITTLSADPEVIGHWVEGEDMLFLGQTSAADDQYVIAFQWYPEQKLMHQKSLVLVNGGSAGTVLGDIMAGLDSSSGDFYGFILVDASSLMIHSFKYDTSLETLTDLGLGSITDIENHTGVYWAVASTDSRKTTAPLTDTFFIVGNDAAAGTDALRVNEVSWSGTLFTTTANASTALDSYSIARRSRVFYDGTRWWWLGSPGNNDIEIYKADQTGSNLRSAVTSWTSVWNAASETEFSQTTEYNATQWEALYDKTNNKIELLLTEPNVDTYRVSFDLSDNSTTITDLNIMTDGDGTTEPYVATAQPMNGHVGFICRLQVAGLDYYPVYVKIQAHNLTKTNWPTAAPTLPALRQINWAIPNSSNNRAGWVKMVQLSNGDSIYFNSGGDGTTAFLQDTLFYYVRQFDAAWFPLNYQPTSWDSSKGGYGVTMAVDQNDYIYVGYQHSSANEFARFSVFSVDTATLVVTEHASQALWDSDNAAVQAMWAADHPDQSTYPGQSIVVATGSLFNGSSWSGMHETWRFDPGTPSLTIDDNGSNDPGLPSFSADYIPQHIVAISDTPGSDTPSSATTPKIWVATENGDELTHSLWTWNAGTTSWDMGTEYTTVTTWLGMTAQWNSVGIIYIGDNEVLAVAEITGSELGGYRINVTDNTTTANNPPGSWGGESAVLQYNGSTVELWATNDPGSSGIKMAEYTISTNTWGSWSAAQYTTYFNPVSLEHAWLFDNRGHLPPSGFGFVNERTVDGITGSQVDQAGAIFPFESLSTLTITDPTLTLTNTFYVDGFAHILSDPALSDSDTFYIDVLDQLLVISDPVLTSSNIMFVDVVDATRYITDPSLVDADTLNVDAMGRETNFNPYWRWRFVRQDGGLYCIPAKSAQAWAGADVVSSDFRFGWDAMEYINLAAAAAWASDSGSATATLKAAIDTALGSFGIKDMEGNVLT